MRKRQGKKKSIKGVEGRGEKKLLSKANGSGKERNSKGEA